VNLTIVESPYNTPTRSRLECIRYALWCCADCDARGEGAFASHLFFTQFIPETKAGRDRGLRYRDEIARRLMTTVARYTDIGQTPGMFRDIDSLGVVEERQLTGEIRAKWLAGEWPDSSCRLGV
jgi:hypothetical protein